MIEELNSVVALCDGCHRAYRVPSPERTYACKACGGTVRVPADEPAPEPDVEPDVAPDVEPETEPPLAHAVTCPACGLIHPHGGDVCSECGEPLDDAPDPYADRDATAGDLKRGYRWMGGVTWLYRAGAAAYAAVTLAAIVAVSRAEVPLGEGLLVVAVATAMTAVLVVAALEMLYHPFRWALAAAALATGAALVHLVGPNPLGVALPLTAACAAVLWVALVPVRGFQRLIDEHTDAFVLDRASRATLRSLRGRSNKQRHDRLMRALRVASRRTSRRAAMVAGIACLASLLATAVVAARVRPVALSDVLADFHGAWRSGDPAQVAAFLYPDVRAHREPWLAGVFTGYGWDGAAPPLREEAVTAAEDGSHEVVHAVAAGVALETTWVPDGRRWSVVRIALPPPPPDAAFESFLRDWRRSDATAIANLFPAGYEDRMREYLERTARRRGWNGFPKVLSTERGEGEDGERIVTLETARERVVAKWVFRGDGYWGLKGLSITDR